MSKSSVLFEQQGLAYVVATHGVLHEYSKASKCPEAQLLTLLGLHSMNGSTGSLPATTKQLHAVMRLSLPLLRSYVRALEARGYVERVRFFRRGPRLLQLTSEGAWVARECNRRLRWASDRVLEWPIHQ